MRPKHALWLAVAVIWSAWFVMDPEARLPSADTPDRNSASDVIDVGSQQGTILSQRF
jgi:hypothetical protein